MKRVKGSAVTNYVVVPHNPAKRIVVRLVLLLLACALVFGAFVYGERRGIATESGLLEERDSLQAALNASVERENELRQQVAVLENGSFVDKEAVDGVRQINRELSDQIAALEEEIALYQGIMSPSVNSSGLTIQEVTVSPTASSDRYRFKVMLTQVGNNSTYLRGFAGINVLGVHNGAVAAYPLSELSNDIEDVDIRFRYRYFQEFEGELNLPDNFTPDQVQVIAQSVGDKAARVERSYNWSDLENANNVGQ